VILPSLPRPDVLGIGDVVESGCFVDQKEGEFGIIISMKKRWDPAKHRMNHYWDDGWEKEHMCAVMWDRSGLEDWSDMLLLKVEHEE